MRALLGVLLLTCAACIADPIVPCGSLACPAGDVCTPGGCATPDEERACRNLADGMPCSADGYMTGGCFGGACHPVACGDGFIDLPEMCDDHNIVDGDGCSSRCDSNETCGNAVIDLVGSEQCDPDTQVGLSHDGCSSTCQLELLRWRDVTPTDITERAAMASAYDERRHEVVVFGGSSAFGDLAQTWIWNGVQWSLARPARSPPARRQGIMVYDTDHQQMVLFGGIGAAGTLADTWVWDGAIWTELHPAVSPPARRQAGFAYDRVHHVALLFGGTGANGTKLGDTWTWDGTTWTQLFPATSPSPRVPAMTYDEGAQTVVLFGGDATTGQTWLWTGTTWQQVFPATTPTPHASVALTYDATRGYVLLFGGLGPSSTSSETWAWNGTDWSHLADRPPARAAAALVYDRQQGDVVLFGGNINPNGGGGQLADTWLWTGSWALADQPPRNPTTRRSPAMAWDARRGRIVMFGGYPLSDPSTWLWRDGAWIVDDATGPEPRYGHEMVYDTERDRIVLFGGTTASGHTADTWEFDGTTWTKRIPSTSPSARQMFGLAYDRAHQRVVLFGGYNGTSVLADTWLWDGSTWTRASPPASPPARVNAALTYDAVHQQVVLFGGYDGAAGLADTWLWDGTTWTNATPALSPSARNTHRLVYDPERQRVVLVGGNSEAADDWEWDGASWSERSPQGVLPVTLSGGAAYDAIAHLLISFGGGNGNGDLSTTRGRDWMTPLGQPESCLLADDDADGDELLGCADPDCWGRCTPLCPPATTCDPSLPRCGDGTCSSVEDTLICPTDCPP